MSAAPKAPCPLAVMLRDAADARAYRNSSVGLTPNVERALANRHSDEARAKVAELVAAAREYLFALEKGKEEFAHEKRLRAALAAFSEVQS